MFKKDLDTLNIDLKSGERLEDLGDGCYIIQNEGAFRFGIDAVLLSDYASKMIGSKTIMAEIGTGSGIIPILMAKRKNYRKITAFEIQEDMADMASRSVKLNGLEEKIEIIPEDIRKTGRIKPNSLDLIVTNPPYTPVIDSKNEPTRRTVNPDLSLALARHEFTLNLDDIFKFAYRNLKQGGKLVMVHRPERLGEIISRASQHRMTVKKARFVHPRIDMKAKMVLLCFSKDGKDSMIVEEPLIIYEGDSYSEEINRIYNASISDRNIIN